MQELNRFVVDEWNHITPEQCKRIIDNMPKRIQALVHARGLASKYWLIKILIMYYLIQIHYDLPSMVIICHVC